MGRGASFLTGLILALRAPLSLPFPGIPVLEHNGDINDPAFAELCVRELLKNLAAAGKS